MSLRVWLPLNGDLHNQGISGIIATGINISVNTTGKIGSCYSFNGSSSYIELNSALCSNETTEFSYTCWVKFNSTASCCLFSNRTAINGNGATLFVNNSGNILYDIGNERHTKTYSFSTDTWYHLAFTYKKGATKKIYVNGTEIYSAGTSGTMTGAAATKSFIGASQNTSTTVNGNYLNGYLNDVRIWNDHCLSAAEVKEIAQGLVLHYKLDKVPSTITNAYGTPYFDANSANGGWNHWGRAGAVGSQGINTDIQYIYYKDKARNHYVTNSADATGEYLVYQSPAFEGGYRSLQCIVKETNSMPITESILFPVWNNRDGGAPGNKWTRVMPLGNGFYLCQVDGVHQDGNNDLIGFYVCPGYTVYFSAAWCENDREVCSDVLFSTDVVEDSSGYNNNGIINGNMSINSNTAKYSNAIVFNGSDNAIKIPFNDIIKTDDYTISVWTYKETIGTKSYQTILGGPSGFELEARSGSSTSPLYRIHNWGGGTTAYEFNKWNLFTFVRTASDSKLYVNGELKLTGTAGTIPTGDYFIGAWSNTTKQNYEGLMSDFRIYCTPLLDTDIKQLYNVSMKIDKLGNSHPFEIDEGTGTQITKTGILKSEQFLETGIQFNANTGFTFKPAANTNNSTTGGIGVVDFSRLRYVGTPITITISCDVAWSNIGYTSTGTNRLYFQGANRLIETGATAWQGSNYLTGWSILDDTKANATGNKHFEKTVTIPATWFETYDGSQFGMRCDYSDGNGTVTVSNVRVILTSENHFKIKKKNIVATQFIER